jgi:hypothetical protein
MLGRVLDRLLGRPPGRHRGGAYPAPAPRRRVPPPPPPYSVPSRPPPPPPARRRVPGGVKVLLEDGTEARPSPALEARMRYLARSILPRDEERPEDPS